MSNTHSFQNFWGFGLQIPKGAILKHKYLTKCKSNQNEYKIIKSKNNKKFKGLYLKSNNNMKSIFTKRKKKKICFKMKNN